MCWAAAVAGSEKQQVSAQVPELALVAAAGAVSAAGQTTHLLPQDVNKYHHSMLSCLPCAVLVWHLRLLEASRALGKSTCRDTSLNTWAFTLEPTVNTAEALLPGAAVAAGQGDAIT
jgi:hypothetical protein